MADRPAHTYTVECDGRKGTTERCDEHAAFFEAVITGQTSVEPPAQAPAKKTLVKPKQPQKAARVVAETGPKTPKRRGKAITTMEEIEKLKR